MGALLAADYESRQEVRALQMPTLFVFADADSAPVSYVAEFLALLGGGLRDGGRDGLGSAGQQLAILPGAMHYDAFASPGMAGPVRDFLDDGVVATMHGLS